MVNAVHDTVVWDVRSSNVRKCGEHVNGVDDFVRHTPGGNLARPAHDKRHAKAPFQPSEIRTPPRATPTVVPGKHLRPIVRRKYENRVVADPQVVDGLEQLPDIRVDLH